MTRALVSRMGERYVTLDEVETRAREASAYAKLRARQAEQGIVTLVEAADAHHTAARRQKALAARASDMGFHGIESQAHADARAHERAERRLRLMEKNR